MSLKKTNKSILFVVNTAQFFLSHRLELACAAQAQGYDVHIAIADEDSWPDTDNANNFTIHYFKLHRLSMNPFKELKTIKELYKLIQTIKPTIVHNLTIKPILYGSIAALANKNIYIINAFTGLGYLYSDKSFKTRLVKQAVMLSCKLIGKSKRTYIIFQNNDDMEELLNKKLVQANQTSLIKGSGVNLTKFQFTPMPKQPLRFLFASRLLKDKGINEYIDAAIQIKQTNPEIEFIVAGWPDSGNPNSISEETLLNLHSNNIITYLGRVSNMTKLIQSCHAVCLPSYYREGVPKILLEAAAAGRVIITTDMPGCKEVVINTHNGYCIQPRDTDSLVSAVKKLIKHPEQITAMGIHSRQLAEKEFDITSVIEKTLQLYNHLLSKANPCAA